MTYRPRGCHDVQPPNGDILEPSQALASPIRQHAPLRSGFKNCVTAAGPTSGESAATFSDRPRPPKPARELADEAVRAPDLVLGRCQSA